LIYKITYGKDTIDVEIDQAVEVLVPHEHKLSDASKLIKNALENPMGKEKFDEFASFEKSLLVIVNDGTRPTPTARIIKELAPVLTKHPNVRFMIATGAHRAPTAEEYKLIFGEYYDTFNDKILVHDARKEEDMIYLGTSSNGTEMYLNKAVKEFDNVLVIGSVEPHYFAGYTGGRKSFLPGVASYKTIEMNHKHALSNRARSLALEGNPVHEDMVDAMNVLKDLNVFSIQTVLTGDHELFAVTAGDLQESFYAAVEQANKIFCVTLKERGNIVLTVAPYPMDVDLYQSQKAVDNGKIALGPATAHPKKLYLR
jgi:nickel-dependent lactate racemase